MSPQERSHSALSTSSGSQSDFEMGTAAGAPANGGPRSSSTSVDANVDPSLSTTSAQQQVEHDHDHDRHYYFLSNAAAAELPLFQYRGQDLSLTYKYVLSPLAEWCVQTLTPRTVAPNTITLTGLVWMIASYVAMWYYLPALLLTNNNDSNNQDNTDIVVPSWVFVLNAVAILIYQTLDNMDGKQARRIGASSPLGLLFDHGCDAINSVFGSANWMVALGLSRAMDLPLAYVMLMGPYALFYVSTWEEYYTGQLVMPILNGPNEGLLGAVAMSVVSAVQGTSYWHQTNIWDATLGQYLPGQYSYRNADLLVMAACVGFVQETILKISCVTRQHGWKAAQNLLPFVTLVVCGTVVGWVDVQIWLQAPRTSLHLCAILFVEMTTELMLQHMTKQSYQPYRWILAPLVLLTVAVATHTWPTHVLSTCDFLMLYAAAAGTYLVMKTVVLIDEICAVLNIWCFDIVTPRRRSRPPAIPERVKNE